MTRPEAGAQPAGPTVLSEPRQHPPTDILTASDIHVSYGPTPALRGACLTVRRGETVALMGPSGSGKSTLLHCLAGILVPDQGSVDLFGVPLHTLPEAARSRRRLTEMGIVFQYGDLIRELTLLENVMLPLQLTGRPRQSARLEAMTALDTMGVAHLADRRGGHVSAGQLQCAAVARALVRRPFLLLADEPTGALDSVSADAVMTALVSAAPEMGAALLVVTHDHRMAAYLDRHLTIRDGVVSGGA